MSSILYHNEVLNIVNKTEMCRFEIDIGKTGVEIGDRSKCVSIVCYSYALLFLSFLNILIKRMKSKAVLYQTGQEWFDISLLET